MTRERRRELVRMAVRECAEILESALDADLGIFDRARGEDEKALVEATMRKIAESLYRRADSRLPQERGA